MKIQGIIFDLDGTILDSMFVWDKVDKEFLGKRGFEVPLEYQKAIAAMGARETAEYTIERFGLRERAEDIMKEWDDMAAFMYHEEVLIKPYVKDFLEELKRQGMKLGVATASYQTLYKPCLKRNGVYDYFHAFAETKEVPRGKGFPDVYIEAAKKIGCQPEHCVVLEDIHEGIMAAKSAGFYTIGVFEGKYHQNWEQMKKDANECIMSFQELLGRPWESLDE